MNTLNHYSERIGQGHKSSEGDEMKPESKGLG